MPEDDFSNRDQKCFNFPRSAASIASFDCELGHREQLNTMTHFIDLSFLYGSDIQNALSTRAFVHGFLLAVRIPGVKHEFLPFRSNPFCHRMAPTDRCFITGDARSESNAFLTALHTVFLRQHNLIAIELGKLNAHWNDETIYQETRKIMIGINQHIIYNQWIPVLIGRSVYEKFQLKPFESGFFMGYDKNQDPGLFNEMATAVLRFGHTLIKHQMHKAHANLSLFEKSPTDQFLFASPKYFKDGIDTQENYMRGLIAEDCYIPSPVGPSLI